MEKNKKPRSRWGTRFLALMLVVILTAFTLTPSQAYTLAMIQVTADPDSWQILSGVVTYDVGVLSGETMEVKRMGGNALEKVAKNETDDLWGALATAIDEYDSGKGEGKLAGYGFEWYRILSFPGYEKTIGRVAEPSSSTSDVAKAQAVNDTLITDLNTAFSMWLDHQGIHKTYSLRKFYEAMGSFLATVGKGDTYTIDGCTFTCAMDKGYNADGTGHEVGRLTWKMIAYEAFNNAVLRSDIAVTPQNVYEAEPGQLTKAIVGFLGNLLDSVRGLLGLWSMDELIFNAGWRGTGYIGGAIPKSWEPHIWGLFMVMQLFAGLVVVLGILNALYKNVLTAINPVQRAKAMEKVWDLVIAAAVIVVLPVALNLALNMASNITTIIYDVLVPDGRDGKRTVSEAVSRYASSSGSLVGIIGQFMFLGIQISFNFIYALRALTIAVLIIIAPIMVAMMVVSDSKKQATMSWLKELLAQICIQPIHAFCLSIILVLPTSTHAFDNILALYALIPFSSLIKSFFFGSAGSWTEQLADRAKSRLTGTLSGAATGAVGALTGVAASKIGEKLDGNKSGDIPEGNSTRQGNANSGSGANTATSMADAVPTDKGGEAGVSATSGSAANGPGGSPTAVSGASTSGAGSAMLSKSTASGTATSKSTPTQSGPSVGRRVLRAVGGTAVTAASIAGGVALGAVGGALNGAGIKGDMNKQLAYMGEKVVRSGTGYGVGKVKSAFEKSPKSEPSAEMPTDGDMGDQGFTAGFTGGTVAAADFTTYDDDKAVSTEWSKAQLEADGISNIEDDKDNLTMKVAADSTLGQSLNKIDAQTSKLSNQEQAEFAKKTGVSITKHPDGSFGVNINKKLYSEANDGAKISYSEKHGNGTLKMTNKASNGTPGGLISNKAMMSGLIVGSMANVQSKEQADGTTKWTIPANDLTVFQKRALNNNDMVKKETNDDGKVVGYSMVTAGSEPPVIKPLDDGGSVLIDPNIRQSAPKDTTPPEDSSNSTPGSDNNQPSTNQGNASDQPQPQGQEQAPPPQNNTPPAPPAVGFVNGTDVPAEEGSDGKTMTKEWSSDQLNNMGVVSVREGFLQHKLAVNPNSEMGRKLSPIAQEVQQMRPDLQEKFARETGVSFYNANGNLGVQVSTGYYEQANKGESMRVRYNSPGEKPALRISSSNGSAPSGSLISSSALNKNVNVSQLQGVTTTPTASGGQQVTIPVSSLTAFQEHTLATTPNVTPVMSKKSDGTQYVSAYQYETNGTSIPNNPISPAPSGSTIGGSPVSNGTIHSSNSNYESDLVSSTGLDNSSSEFTEPTELSADLYETDMPLTEDVSSSNNPSYQSPPPRELPRQDPPQESPPQVQEHPQHEPPRQSPIQPNPTPIQAPPVDSGQEFKPPAQNMGATGQAIGNFNQGNINPNPYTGENPNGNGTNGEEHSGADVQIGNKGPNSFDGLQNPQAGQLRQNQQGTQQRQGTGKTQKNQNNRQGNNQHRNQNGKGNRSGRGGNGGKKNQK